MTLKEFLNTTIKKILGKKTLTPQERGELMSICKPILQIISGDDKEKWVKLKDA